LPRQLRECGLDAERLTVPDETLRHVISRYTREAGVRQLERALGRLCRKVALGVAEGRTEPMTVRPEDLHDMLGPEMVFLERARATSPPGVVAGLAVTETGGDVLYVESTLLPGGSDLTLTGQLGEVMQESARAARSYAWAHARALGIDPEAFKGAGVHIHVPAGAIPKDGPSAGVTMVTALASLYSGRAARTDTAMTGEITLTGLVLPVGGIKEKVLAARRTGFKRVVLPKANAQDLRDLPEHVRAEMEFVLVERISEVLEAILEPAAPQTNASLIEAPRVPDIPAGDVTKIARRARGSRPTRIAPPIS
jgi:ATP-dependent Lon protease